MDFSDCSSCLNETIISFSGVPLMSSSHLQTDHWRAEGECLCWGSSLVFPVESDDVEDDYDDDEYLNFQQNNRVWFFN